MALPIAKIIWAKTDPGAHWNHLHVEGIPRLIGWTTGAGAQPPARNPGMTDSVWAIYVALSEKFGTPAYMRGGDWNHMGWYNRRPIGGKTQWSQHAWANAIDIGPYYGVAEQQRFYDFLTSEENDEVSQHGPEQWDDADWSAWRAQNIATGVGLEFGGPVGSSRRKTLTQHIIDIKNTVGALDLEGVSEAELDVRVASLAATIKAQPSAFIAKLKESL